MGSAKKPSTPFEKVSLPAAQRPPFHREEPPQGHQISRPARRRPSPRDLGQGSRDPQIETAQISCSHAGPWVRSRPRVIEQLHNVFLQGEVVAGTWKEGQTRNHGGTAATVCDALQEFDLLWDDFSPAAQARIVALLVNRIDTHTEGRDIHAPVDGLNGLNGLAAEIAALTNGEKHEQY